MINDHEEPCEGGLSLAVLWEGREEIPLPDPISSNQRLFKNKISV
jgi:hypothetical protein